MPAPRKIKVCHITAVHQVYDNRIFYKECRSLAADYEVFLVAPAIQGGIKDGVAVRAVPVPRGRLQRFLITDMLLFFKALGTGARLMHLHDPELIPMGLIFRLMGKKVIYDIEEDFRADFKEKPWLPFKSLFKALYILSESLALRFFHIIIAEDSYAPIYKDHTVTVIHNFAPLHEIKCPPSGKRNESNTIGFIGNLAARRGLPYMLQALYLLQQKGVIINMICVGAKDEAVGKILEASEVWPHVQGQVVFKGYVPFPQGLYLLNDCFAGMALPETLPNHLRSYPTKMFEYMAIGLPVIASAFPFYREVIDKYSAGLTVKPEDSTAIADAIEYLYNQKDKAVEMGRNGAEAVKHFDWATEAETLNQLYKQILRQK